MGFRVMETEITASEALWGFTGWITSLQTPVTVSGSHGAADMVDMLSEFCHANQLSTPRDGWGKRCRWPDTRKLITNDGDETADWR